MIHESGQWSSSHQKWFFLPRKLSREVYDEVKDQAKCVNLILACGDGGSDVAAATYLEPQRAHRGCSDFFFVPGTNDTHIFLIRTEETINGDLATLASVIDVTGAVLMEETQFAAGRKFEGCCIVPQEFTDAVKAE